MISAEAAHKARADAARTATGELEKLSAKYGTLGETANDFLSSTTKIVKEFDEETGMLELLNAQYSDNAKFAAAAEKKRADLTAEVQKATQGFKDQLTTLAATGKTSTSSLDKM